MERHHFLTELKNQTKIEPRLQQDLVSDLFLRYYWNNDQSGSSSIPALGPSPVISQMDCFARGAQPYLWAASTWQFDSHFKAILEPRGHANMLINSSVSSPRSLLWAQFIWIGIDEHNGLIKIQFGRYIQWVGCGWDMDRVLGKAPATLWLLTPYAASPRIQNYWTGNRKRCSIGTAGELKIPPPFKENPSLSKAHRDESHTAMWTKEGRRQRPQAQDGNHFPEITPPNMQKKKRFCNLRLKEGQLKPSKKKKKKHLVTSCTSADLGLQTTDDRISNYLCLIKFQRACLIRVGI